MFALLNPAALLALTGLLVPVAIHLWNRRPGREVAVGSLRWLAAGANRRLRNLKLEQLGLLLLRAALLALLAVAVAGPVWRQPASRGVVLLGPEVRRLPALAALRPGIDSLRRRGYALRWLEKGFPKVSAMKWRAAGTGSGTDSVTGGDAVGIAWARVQQAVSTFPDQPLYVVTAAGLRDLQGSHPSLPATVAWRPLPDTATASWLQAATIWGRRGDSLRLLVGRSTATQVTFRTETIGYRNEPHEQFRVPGLAPLQLHTLADDSRTFELEPAKPGPGPATAISCGTPPQVIEIYASPAYAADARYLQAALRAAATGWLNPPVLRRVAERPRDLAADWTFWLSDEPLPESGRQRSRSHVWREATGPGVADTARLATTEAQGAPVTVFRRGAAQPAIASQPVWVDGRGRAVLSCQTGPAGTFYQLHTRLNPSWSTFPDDPQLPARLLRLLQPIPTDEGRYAVSELDRRLARYDHRALDPAQLVSAAHAQPAATAASLPNQRITDLRPWLVLAAGLLFLMERLLARRRESHVPNSSL